MKALLKPRQGRPGDADERVELIARTGGGKVTVQLGASRTFSVDGWRLYDLADRTRRLAATDLARLPWNGKGPDPLNVMPLSPDRGRGSARSAPGEGVALGRASHPLLTSPSSEGEEHEGRGA